MSSKIIQCFNRLKKKNYMIISSDTQKKHLTKFVETQCALLSKTRNKAKMPMLTTLIPHTTGSSSYCQKSRKGKWKPDGLRTRTQNYCYLRDMLVHIGNQRDL